MSSMSRRLLDLRCSLPLEHATMRAKDADETAHDRVGREEHLTGEQNDREAELLARAQRVTAERGVVGPPCLIARWPRGGEQQRNGPRRAHRRERDGRPDGARAR